MKQQQEDVGSENDKDETKRESKSARSSERQENKRNIKYDFWKRKTDRTMMRMDGLVLKSHDSN